MSTFKDGRYPVELDKERHLLVSLNALDEMQDKFGGLGKLDEALTGPQGMKNLKWMLALLINEGAAEDEEPVTEKMIGKLVHAGNLGYVQDCVFRAIAQGQKGVPELDADDLEDLEDDSAEDGADDDALPGNAAAGQES